MNDAARSGNPQGRTDELWAAVVESTEQHWGTLHGIDPWMWTPSTAHDERAAGRLVVCF